MKSSSMREIESISQPDAIESAFWREIFKKQLNIANQFTLQCGFERLIESNLLAKTSMKQQSKS